MMIKNSMMMMIIMSLVACGQATHHNSGNRALATIEKLGIVEDFTKAVQDFTPEHLKTENKIADTAALKAYEEQFFQPSIGEKLATMFAYQYAPADLESFDKLDPEEIIKHNPIKFKAFEDAVEKYYDDIYLAAQRLQSGIQETEKPDPKKPFSFFTINKPNAIYLVDVYDSMLPQNSQFNKETWLDASAFKNVRFVEIAFDSYGIAFDLGAAHQQKVQDLLKKDPKAILALIVDHRMVSLRQVDLIQDQGSYIWFAPWGQEEIKAFVQALKQ